MKRGVSLSETVIDDSIKDKEKGDKLNLSFEEKHKDKDYIVLLHEIEVILKKDYSYTTRVHRIVKILQEGGKSMGEITVPYRGDEKNNLVCNPYYRIYICNVSLWNSQGVIS